MPGMLPSTKVVLTTAVIAVLALAVVVRVPQFRVLVLGK